VSRLQAPRGARPVATDPEQGAHPSLSIKRIYATFLAIAAVVAVIDQLTKQWVLDELSGGRVIDVIDGVLRLRLTFNPGGAFGIGQSVPWLFLGASLITLVVVLVLARRIEHPAWAYPLGLVLGGGIGNIYDRLFRDTDGRVVDFIDLHVWPLFNVADSAIVVGVVWMFILSFRSRN
jgi:signal peptidase II